MKHLVLILLTVSLTTAAQQQLPPCGSGVYPCINVGGSPAILYHPEDNQAVPPQQMQGENQDLEIYRDQQEWLFAQRWVERPWLRWFKGFSGSQMA